MFWKCIQYAIQRDKTQMSKTFPLDKINGRKNFFFFLHELKLLRFLPLTCDSYMSWNTRVVSLKLCVEFSVFNCGVSFLLKFIFLFNKMYGFFDIKTFFFIWVSFTNIHKSQDCKERKEEDISLTPHYHIHRLHRHLDICGAITADSSPLHIASSWTWTGNLWFPSASH